MSLRQSLGVGCLVLNQTLGALGKRAQREVETWLNRCGPEWTCARLKAIWSATLCIADKDVDGAKRVYQENSISYRKSSMLPKGAWGAVAKRYLDAKRPSVQRRIAACLRFYTSMSLPAGHQPTARQMRKLIPAVIQTSECDFDRKKASVDTCVTDFRFYDGEGSISPPPLLDDISYTSNPLNRLHLDLSMINSYRKIIATGNMTAAGISVGTRKVIRDRMKSVGYSAKPISGREDGAEWLHATSYYYTPIPSEFIPQAIREAPYGMMVCSLNSTEWLPDSLDYNTRCAEMRAELRSKGVHDQFIGRYTVLQEQGCKPRGVFQPTAWVQLACQPYHRKIDQACLRLYPNECDVHDQVRGVYDAVEHLRQGKPVSCVDLSSATDRFPRFVTVGILEELGYPEFAQALEEISSQKWECPYIPEGYVTCGSGQPMGVYGSFPSFTLSNLALCDVALRLAFGKQVEAHPTRDVAGTRDWHDWITPFPSGAYFHVVGDDVIFSDIKVATEYRACLTTLGVKTSSEKCFSNGHIAEFAGFIIRKDDDHNPVAYRPYKVPNTGYVSNPLDFLHALGAKAKKLPRRTEFWKRSAEAFEKTLPWRTLDLSPILPDEDEWLPSNGAHASDLVTLSRKLGYLLTGEKLSPDALAAYCPCLDGDTRINRRPIIDEITPWDYRRFNPETYADQKESIRRRPKPSVWQDPLMKEIRETGSLSLGSPLIVEPSPIDDESQPSVGEPQVTGSCPRITETSICDATVGGGRFRDMHDIDRALTTIEGIEANAEIAGDYDSIDLP